MLTETERRQDDFETETPDIATVGASDEREADERSLAARSHELEMGCDSVRRRDDVEIVRLSQSVAFHGILRNEREQPMNGRDEAIDARIRAYSLPSCAWTDRNAESPDNLRRGEYH